MRNEPRPVVPHPFVVECLGFNTSIGVEVNSLALLFLFLLLFWFLLLMMLFFLYLFLFSTKGHEKSHVKTQLSRARRSR